MELPLQKHFFEVLKSNIPSSSSLAEEVSEFLQISLDGAYRRIRGEIAISLDDTIALSKKFNLPLSSLGLAPPNMVTFYVGELGTQRQGFDEYLQRLLADVKMTSEAPNGYVTYAAEDIPVFYHFSSKVLSYFKMFYWMKAIQNVDDLTPTKFSPDMFGDFYENVGQHIYKYYARIPTTEIWTEETIQSTIGQIKFFWDAGFIEEKSYCLLICDELKNLVSLTKKQTETSEKMYDLENSSNKEFKFYVSDLMVGTNGVLAKIGDNRVSFLSYNTFNTIKTNSAFFADQTESWLNNLVNKSTLICGAGERQRNQFFKKLYGAVEKLREYVEQN